MNKTEGVLVDPSQEIPQLKKKKSFIQVTRRSTHDISQQAQDITLKCKDINKYPLRELMSYHSIKLAPNPKLSHDSTVGFLSSVSVSMHPLAKILRPISTHEKENVGMNVTIHKITPKQEKCCSHYQWFKHTSKRSDLVKLEREIVGRSL